MPRLTKAQQEQDSFVLGAILAGASEKLLVPNERGAIHAMSACAIGAGVIGLKIDKPRDVSGRRYSLVLDCQHTLIPLQRFAAELEVSENYVCGINDGFEQGSISKDICPKVSTRSVDYLRGWNIGEAARIESGL